jgi:Spy/CpxP family protein refolding chaperone
MHGFLGGLIADDLDLSDAQREEIHGIFEAARFEGEPLWAAVNESRGQLMEASAAEPFSEADVRAAATRLGNAEAEIAIHRARVMAQVRTVLTPEQRERAQELMQRMRERRQDSREERRGDWGG